MAPSCACLWGLMLLAALAHAKTRKEDKLLRWIVSRGGKVGLRIRKECDVPGNPGPRCHRVAVAHADFRPGDTIASVPFNCTVYLRKPSGFDVEQAHELTMVMHRDAKFNHSFALFLAALPRGRDLLTPVQYTDAQLDMLQAHELGLLVVQRRAVAEWVYWGRAGIAEPPPQVRGALAGLDPVVDVLGEDRVSLDQFKHLHAVITDRGFLVGKGTALVPGIDFLSYADDPNTQLAVDDDAGYVLKAKKAIKAGEVLTKPYPGAARRPDAMLFGTGFVREEEEPLLCGIDLPDYDSTRPWAANQDNDDAHDPAKGGKYATPQEIARLAGRLGSMPTTLEQDEELLASGSLKDWRDRAIVEFRVARKKAIKQVLERISKSMKKMAARSLEEEEDSDNDEDYDRVDEL